MVAANNTAANAILNKGVAAPDEGLPVGTSTGDFDGEEETDFTTVGAPLGIPDETLAMEGGLLGLEDSPFETSAIGAGVGAEVVATILMDGELLGAGVPVIDDPISIAEILPNWSP